MFEEKANYSQNLGIGKLLLLALASFLLSNTVIMGVFSPFPMAIAIVLFGRGKGYFATLVTVGISLAFLWQGYPEGPFNAQEQVALLLQLSYYFMFFLVTVLCAESVLRSWKPEKTIVYGGLIIFALVFMTVVASFSFNNLKTKELISSYLEKNKSQIEQVMQGEEDSFKTMALLSQPEKLANIVNQEFPRVLFLMVMFSVWANFALTLKAKKMTHIGLSGYSEKSVIHFEVADSLIYGLIFSLLLYLFGETLLGSQAGELGKTLLYMCGTFYFFKGFGIFINFLDMIGLVGFFRTLMIIFSVLLMKEIIAFVGLFDIWFNFNGKILNKINQDTN